MAVEAVVVLLAVLGVGEYRVDVRRPAFSRHTARTVKMPMQAQTDNSSKTCTTNNKHVQRNTNTPTHNHTHTHTHKPAGIGLLPLALHSAFN